MYTATFIQHQRYNGTHTTTTFEQQHVYIIISTSYILQQVYKQNTYTTYIYTPASIHHHICNSKSTTQYIDNDIDTTTSIHHHIHNIIYNNIRKATCIQQRLYNTIYTTSCVQHQLYNTIHTTQYIHQQIHNNLNTPASIQHNFYTSL